MSSWSSCEAIIRIFTYKMIPDFEKVVSQMIQKAPKITGSEGNCKVIAIDFVEGNFTSKDCNRCSLFNIRYDPDKYKSGCPGWGRATPKQLSKCNDAQ